MTNQEYKVLYTHQKTKKHKTWQDGILILHKDKKKVILCEEGSRTVLETLFLRSDQITVGEEIESERYLITIEEEMNRDRSDPSCQVAADPHTVKYNHNTFKRKNREFCIPKSVSKERTVNNIEPLNKMIKLQDNDFVQTFKKIDQNMPTKKQFFTMYSKNNQDKLENKELDKQMSSQFDSFAKEMAVSNQNTTSNCCTPINKSCHNKRNTSQILALFSSNNNSKPEEPISDAKGLQVCPPSPLPEIFDSDDICTDCQDIDPHNGSKASQSYDEIGSPLNYNCENHAEITSSSVISIELPLKVDVASVLRKPYSKPQFVGKNHSNRGSFDASSNLFQVPDVDLKEQKKESSTISYISCRSLDNITCKENTLSSEQTCKKKTVSISCPSNKQRQNIRYAATARKERSISSSTKVMEHELLFPTSKDCENNVKPCRQVIIPVVFQNCDYYQKTLTAALKEHLNILLFELAKNYHSALRKVDITQYSSVNQGVVSDERPSCPHGISCLRSVKKEGPNKGRLFYCCPGTNKSQCKFFKWVNEYKNAKQGQKPTAHTNKPSLCSADAVIEYFASQGLTLHCECRLSIKRKNSYAGKPGKHKGYRYSKRQLEEDGSMGNKKSMYLELSKKRRLNITYSKNDVWVISTSLLFEKQYTFVAKSTYFGPYSSGELEISPIGGYCPSNWRSGDTVYALHGCNASNELICIENIDMYVNNRCMPLLDSLLDRQNDAQSTRKQVRYNSFAPPVSSSQRLLDNVSSELSVTIAEEIIHEYHLNTDQRSALLNCANMFTAAPSNISLIQGVFGAGKSYLLAVTILYLVRMDKIVNKNEGASSSSKFKILVSSTTNVAVDRILLALLDLGFEEFVRVGSVRKIAKQLLPYSMQGCGSHNQELKDLQAMLKEDLEPSERQNISKSIEKQRRGENEKRLDRVQVVGVTCAACVFPCLEKIKFSVALLDECSQMTEPTALLPIARFGCRKIILVGDPKQLSPTIAGSTPGSHLEQNAGLEQTLFDRLSKMGYKTTLLRTQYRCHPSISAVANRLFYGGNLVDGITPDERAPLVDFSPTLCFYDVSRGQEKWGHDDSFYNEQEAKFVVFLVGCLLESGVEPEQIGVITLYKSQFATISSHLAQSRLASQRQLKAVQISTVDAFQGGEKDVILLSCVRTDHVGFIDCGRRTNVALTRAKRHLLIIGNERMLSSNEMWRSVIQQCRIYYTGGKDHSHGVQSEESENWVFPHYYRTVEMNWFFFQCNIQALTLAQVGGVVSAEDFESFWQKGSTRKGYKDSTVEGKVVKLSYFNFPGKDKKVLRKEWIHAITVCSLELRFSPPSSLSAIFLDGHDKDVDSPSTPPGMEASLVSPLVTNDMTDEPQDEQEDVLPNSKSTKRDMYDSCSSSGDEMLESSLIVSCIDSAIPEHTSILTQVDSALPDTISSVAQIDSIKPEPPSPENSSDSSGSSSSDELVEFSSICVGNNDERFSAKDTGTTGSIRNDINSNRVHTSSKDSLSENVSIHSAVDTLATELSRTDSNSEEFDRQLISVNIDSLTESTSSSNYFTRSPGVLQDSLDDDLSSFNVFPE